MAPSAGESPPRVPTYLRPLTLVAIWIAFSFFYYFNAFITDDAFISFRTVDNFVRGYGLRWNVAERVQVFTAPLHTLLVSAFYWFTHDRSWLPNPNRFYFTSMSFSYAASLTGILWLAWRSSSPYRALAVFLILMSSQAFVTFTSSGLETPLIYLFVILFYVQFLYSDATGLASRFGLLVCAALAVVNRLDTALLFFPACCYLVIDGYRRFGFGVWRAIAPASIPILAWFGFSLVYFGFLLPNPYYAKMSFGADPSILWEMGEAYLRLSFHQDPITLSVIGCGIILSLFELKTFLAGLSSFLYVAYICHIGGDFIGFRFLAPPFLLSTLVIQRFAERRLGGPIPVWSAVAVVGLLLYGSLTPSSPLRAYRDPPKSRNVRVYFPGSSLARWSPGRDFPFASFQGIRSYEYCRAQRNEGPLTMVGGSGLPGFCRGPEQHLISPNGNTDPLQARLPVEVRTHFLPGHLPRLIPAGYVESAGSGINRIRDEKLAAYYAKILLVTRGPLFSGDRWRAIFELNLTGQRRYTSPYILADSPYPPWGRGGGPSLVDRWRAIEAGRRR